MTLFEQLPDTSQTWLYASDRVISEEESHALLSTLHQFRDAWTTHGRRVESGVELLENCVLILAAHVPDGDMSGCGIDKSLHAMDAVARDAGFSWVSGLTVVYRTQDGLLHTTSRVDFAHMAAQGEITPRTTVVDLSIRSLGELRSGGIERPAGSSWHSKYFTTVPSLSS